MASKELVRGVVSASLLNPSWDDLTKFVENPDFDLGMGEWLSDPLPADFEGMSAWMSSLPDLSCITDMDDGIDENSSSAPKRSRLSLPKKGVPIFKEVGIVNRVLVGVLLSPWSLLKERRRRKE